MAGRLKMDEIAEQTGYSVSTVSRVLSGKSYTSNQARDAIVACARRLGVLDDLASGRLLINGIAVFAPARTFSARGDIFYHEVTRGIADAIAAHDVYLSYCSLEEQHADIALFMEKVGNKNINALIIIGVDDPTVLRLAETLSKPCVLINTDNREMRLDAVSPDHRAIGYNAAKHLFDHGHRRILTLTPLRRDTLHVRLEGIKDAYRHFHVPFDAQQDLLITEGFSAQESASMLASWLAARPKAQWPQALLCSGAEMTSGVKKVLAQQGLRVPEDIAIICTDFDWHLEPGVEKPVSGITVPCRELGVEAVYLLQTRLNRPQAPVFNLLIQGRVVDRGTVSQATRHAARVAVDK
nr:LacI family DNA-binding transcriptional regulator [uncultured Enterobacter sp.]